MLDLSVVPMAQFERRWRFTDAKYRLLPPHHLEQIQPLDNASASRLLDLTRPWLKNQPFTDGFFKHVESIPIDWEDDNCVRAVRKWLYQRGLPFKHQVLLSWDETDAVTTTWKMVVKYWDDFWYPASDDLAVFDESLSWALFFWHEEVAYFASHLLKTTVG